MNDNIMATGRLPIGSMGRSPGWWGMLCLILTEASLFVFLLYSYYLSAARYGRSWLPPELPEFRLSLPNTIILIASSVAAWWGERGARRGSQWQLVAGLLVAIILGAIFARIQVMEWMSKPFTFASSSYGSVYFTITAFHMAHLVPGLLVLAALLGWSLFRYFSPERHTPVSIGVLYWHFVDIVWLTLFFTFYITPRLQ